MAAALTYLLTICWDVRRLELAPATHSRDPGRSASCGTALSTRQPNKPLELTPLRVEQDQVDSTQCYGS
jgi:hypothetical protein